MSVQYRGTSGAGVKNTSQVIGERIWDLTGYATPTISSTTQSRLHNDGVTFTVPPSGWVRVSLSGITWSGGGAAGWWMILNANGTAVPRTQLAINGNAQPAQSQLEVLVNCTASNIGLVPGQSVTWYWGWVSPDGSTITFDNSLSVMKVEAAEAPQGYTVGGDSVAGQTNILNTPENVATQGAVGPSSVASWSNTPQTNDLLLALFMANVAPASWVLPTGWVIAKSQQIGTGARYLGLCYKVAGAGEPTSLTFTGTAATLTAVHLWSKRGFTGTPTVALTTGASNNLYTTGTNIATSGGLATSPQYGVAAVGAGSTVAISRIANGWDAATVFADRGTIFNDNTVTAMAASQKLLTEIGANPLMSPTFSAGQPMGALIVTFSGV